MRALSCGLRAAAWWLQRHSSPVSPIVAVGLGVAAAAAVLAGGPWVLPGMALAASAVGLAGFDALAHAGSVTVT
jgi:hypothetical protein